jgi:2',3'-cyclic-nucleotide 2'-phosphodiesterase (5'-nucleotidase family)
MQAQQNQYLTIMHLNDTHSNLVAGTPRAASGQGLAGGVARAATIIKAQYASELPPVLLHSGDAFIGDPMFNLAALPPSTQISPDLEALKALGCDAMTLGNHEFDIGPDLLTGVLINTFGVTPDYVNENDFPMLSANIDIPPSYGYGAILGQHVHPYTIIERGPFKIGVIGLTTPATNVLSDPSPVRILGKNETEMGQVMYAVGGIAQNLVVDLGCNYVILLSHMGMELDKLIATNVPLIDVIVGGHDHIGTHKPVHVRNSITNKKVEIVQTEGFYRQIGKIVLRLHNGSIDVQHYTLIDLDATVAEDAEVLGMLSPIVTGIETYVPGLFSLPVTSCSGVFTELVTGLNHPGPKDTHVGNFVADVFQNGLGVDIGIEPSGSTAQALYPGPIYPVDIFRMIGYGANDVTALGFRPVTFTMTGAALAEGIEKTLANNEVDDEYLLQVSSNLRYVYDPKAPVGSRLSAVYFKNSPVDFTATYSIATNELVVMFLDMLEVDYDNLAYVPGVYSEFELVLGYIMANSITALPCGPKPGRIQAVCSSQNSLTRPANSTAKLSANSPNPFNNETVVTYSLDEAAPVTIKVYDIVGREVATLQEGYVAQGIHTAMFDADRLPAGLYFCRMLTPDGIVQTMKMLKTR